MSLWWLSFADASRPEGDQLLGCAIVEADDITSAIRVAWAIGCNPGGEVQSTWIDPDRLQLLSFSLPIGVLLSPAEARALSERVGKDIGS